MATAFEITGDWHGTIDGGFDTNKSVEGLPAPAPGFIWRRKKYVVNRYRNGKGVTGFAPLAGEEVDGSKLSVNNGTDNLTASSSDTYYCAVDRLIPDPPSSGIWKQVQSWQHFEEWEEYEIPAVVAGEE